MRTEILERGRGKVFKYYNDDNILERADITDITDNLEMSTIFHPDGKTIKRVSFYDLGNLWLSHEYNEKGNIILREEYDTKGNLIKRDKY